MGNTFGRLFRITTWGESHGGAVGVVVAEVELRVGSRLAPGVGVPPAVVDAAALIEATARDRCDLEPHRAFTRSGRGETSDTIPASGSGD